MDHKVNIEKNEGCPYFDNEKGKGKHMLVIQDVYTQWLQAYPVPKKDTESVLDRILTYFGSEYHPNYSGPGGKKVPSEVYSDNANEFSAAFKGLHWIADTCTPHRKETNGIAERAIRRVREGTASALVQAGMDPIWWAEASQCFCFLRAIRDLLHPDEKTAFERRFGRPFQGPLSPLVPRSTSCHLIQMT